MNDAKKTKPAHRVFSVWRDNQEQWDADDIDEPVFAGACASFEDAAIAHADDFDLSRGDFIVRDDASGEYRTISIQRSWTTTSNTKTSLEELCAP